MARVLMLYRHLDLSHRDTLNRLVACVIDDSTNDGSAIDAEVSACQRRIARGASPFFCPAARGSKFLNFCLYHDPY